ncbi:MAG: tetratricopeptide repeat protein [bacterium]
MIPMRESIHPPYARRALRFVRLLPICLCLWLTACATVPLAAVVESESESVSESKSESRADERVAGAELSADLLHDLLLAQIATQRGRGEVALEALSRAAHHSRDRDIVGEAIRLAARMRDHRRVIELSALLADEQRELENQLALANARFELGHRAQALKIAVDLARAREVGAAGEESALRAIAALLARHAPAKSPQRMLAQFSQAATTTEPRAPTLTLTTALLALELRADAQFAELLDAALRQSPGWETAAMLKLSHLAEDSTISDATQATDFADAFVRTHPSAAKFRVRYGLLLLQAGRTDDAMAQLEAALAQNPKSPQALFASALAHAAQGRPLRALAQLRESLALDPRNDRARLHIADLEIERAQWDAALSALRGVSAPSLWFDAQVKLAGVLAQRDDIEAGIRHLDQIDAYDEAESARVVIAQSSLYREFAMHERAMALLGQNLARTPRNPDLLYARGLLAAELERLEIHERDMRELIALRPDDADAYNALGYTLADQNLRLDEALELITTALSLSPRNGFILDSMGWVHFRLGDNDRAIEYLRRALAANRDATIAAHLGEALWIAGERRTAREIWHRAMQWESDNAVLIETVERLAGDAPGAASSANELETRWMPTAPARG